MNNPLTAKGGVAQLLGLLALDHGLQPSLQGDICRASLTLIVSGRRLDEATGFCAARSGCAAKLQPLAFDRTAPTDALTRLQPDLVVDASGPFQVYGDDPYRLAKACIVTRCHYADLADGAAFVEGIAALDETAKAAGVFLLSGMSSFPVLTAAVSRHLAKDFDKVETITAGIAPSPYAGVGLNVVRAIASYAGKPVDVLHTVDG